MWMIFGVLAIAATLVNFYLYQTGKDYRLCMVLALALTALTLCAMYSLIASWAVTQDWSAIEDVAPTMSKALWVLTGISIVLNGMPLILDTLRKKRG